MVRIVPPLSKHFPFSRRVKPQYDKLPRFQDGQCGQHNGKKGGKGKQVPNYKDLSQGEM